MLHSYFRLHCTRLQMWNAPSLSDHPQAGVFEWIDHHPDSSWIDSRGCAQIWTARSKQRRLGDSSNRNSENDIPGENETDQNEKRIRLERRLIWIAIALVWGNGQVVQSLSLCTDGYGHICASNNLIRSEGSSTVSGARTSPSMGS